MKNYVAAIGSTTIDTYYEALHWPKLGDKEKVKYIDKKIGGMISNAACVMASCGIPTYLIDFVEPEQKELIFKELHKYKVNTDYIILLDGYSQSETTIYLVGGERVIFLNKNKPKINLSKQTQNMLENAAAIYSILPEFINIIGFNSLLKKTKKTGVKLVFDIEPATFSGTKEERDLLKKADILFFNKQGMKKYRGEISEENTLKKLHQVGVKIVVVTKAENGCLVSGENEKFELPALKVSATDTTGAGDAFNSMFLLGTLKGWPLAKCAYMANAAGAYAVTQMGPKTGIESLTCLEDFAKKHMTKEHM